MSTNANFASTPNGGGATISTANTARDGSGTLGTVLTAGAGGARIDSLIIQAVGTTTAGAVRLFIHDGATARMIDEFSVPAITPSLTQPPFRQVVSYPIVLKTGHSLKASTNNAEPFNVVPLIAGDF